VVPRCGMMRCAGCRHLDLSAVVIIHPIVLWLEFPFLARHGVSLHQYGSSHSATRRLRRLAGG
jgi:hypothetical protein